ncbi:YCF48-related protein [Stutzerimonas tarimensis]|uniref:YCF48-related protein n=1 Tax=Stutzerimonas tarimensis TaxID=1507735 RepID=A0ABV7T234_9GAMM
MVIQACAVRRPAEAGAPNLAKGRRLGQQLRGAFLALLCVSLAGPLLADSAPDVLAQPAAKLIEPGRAVLLGITRAGDRLVAVGERGIILLSDDHGSSWRQGSVPVRISLTDVQFVDERHGWAVGHSGVVLHSRDGGETWNLQLDGRQAAALELEAAEREAGPGSQRLDNARLLVDDGPDKPFLVVHFSDARNGIVAGAFGMAFRTRDGGETWSSIIGRLPNDWGAHLYAIASRDRHLYIAGEQGLFMRSTDDGTSFEAVETGYEGSYFTLALLPADALLVGGLRGTVMLSDDAGESFRMLDNPVPVSLNDAVTLDDRLLLVNQAGGLLEVAGGSLRPLPVRAGAPLSAVARTADGGVVGVGFNGPVSLSPLTPANAHASAE